MKKEELRYDPVHERIAGIVEYIDKNKKLAIQALLILGLIVGGWGYYSGVAKDKLNLAKSLSGVAQNAYNSGQIEISLSELNNIVEDYTGTDAANQAMTYLVMDSYLKNEDVKIKSLTDKFGTGVPDGVLDAGIFEALGNASMNTENFKSAVNDFKKADKLASVKGSELRFKIDIALAMIGNGEFNKAVILLNDIIDVENISYSDKNKVEELLALANFRIDN